MSHQLIKEIDLFFHGENLDSASKRLLDFAWYYLRGTELYKKIESFRSSYNENKTLGDGNSTGTKDKVEEFTLLLNEVKQLTVTEETHLERSLLIQIKDLEKTFSHRSKSFSFGPVSIDLFKGEILGVVGENGNGKTTFLRLIHEEINSDEGSIEFNYDLNDIDASENYKRKNRVAFIPQRIPKWRGTLMENLSYYSAIHGFKGEENTEIVNYVIHRMGLTTFSELTWNQLSSGYKLRFELAKMLVWEPNILILDEPLANLDIQATQALLDDMKFFAESVTHPIGIILTSQQLHEVEQVSTKILFLKNGKPVYSGELTSFGEGQENGTLEFSVSNKVDDFETKITAIEGIISVNIGTKIHLLKFDKEKKSSFILMELLKLGLEINYYRDISNSTVQLFNQ